MQLHPWVITSWPTIERACELAPDVATDLQHLGTVVSIDGDEYGRLQGHTIWGVENLQVGVAWDWTEMREGVFALSDPMGVVSNIGFVDETGASIPESFRAIQLNRITHALGWQAEVFKATRTVRTTLPWAKRMRPPSDGHFRASDLGGLAASMP